MWPQPTASRSGPSTGACAHSPALGRSTAPIMAPKAEMERYAEVVAALKLRHRPKGRHLSTQRAIELLETAGVETPDGLLQAPSGLLKRPPIRRDGPCGNGAASAAGWPSCARPSRTWSPSTARPRGAVMPGPRAASLCIWFPLGPTPAGSGWCWARRRKPRQALGSVFMLANLPHHYGHGQADSALLVKQQTILANAVWTAPDHPEILMLSFGVRAISIRGFQIGSVLASKWLRISAPVAIQTSSRAAISDRKLRRIRHRIGRPETCGWRTRVLTPPHS